MNCNRCSEDRNCDAQFDDNTCKRYRPKEYGCKETTFCCGRINCPPGPQGPAGEAGPVFISISVRDLL